MKNNVLVIGMLSVALTACGVGMSSNGISLGLGLGGLIGNHVGVGTSINIPLTFDKTNTETTQKVGDLNVDEQKIITHFDAQGRVSDAAVKGGFFRQLLAKQGNNAYLVQDFYDNGKKRTEPMILQQNQLFEFRAHPNDGAYTVYAINGNIMQQQNFRNGKLITTE